ncbi:Bifunctional glutamate/proline--tRNA ligase-like [Homarus americanus]|uniref:Bifunctional glutamate/proline--tRNA ligase-like n=1 Tax=Homarus americanus TaxID=6706 RepID=A0A8J5KA78_HOMAM|nr:Bifunctional glutamate/proline--tRNA ligase-like [Homarus americanus]
MSGALITCSKAGVSVEWGKDTSLALSDTFSVNSSHGISRHVARVNPSLDLYPSHILHRTEVDHWLSTASGPLSCGGDISATLEQLNRALAPSDELVGNHITVADFEVFAALYKNAAWHMRLNSGTAPVNVLRWYNFIEKQVGGVIAALPGDVQKVFECSKTTPASPDKSASGSKKKEEGGKFVELPGAKLGEVVVRFPPEASGYLHIGHAKAALLNQYYQLAFKGKLIMRFDDTNPEKEKLDYEKVILEDLKLLEIKPNIFTHTSDHFDRMITMCEQLIRQGLAYCDDTDGETMKKEREERKESKNYNNSAEKNLSMWEEMKRGTDYGLTCCVRARINMKSDNGCMRDPTIYRCKNEPHVRTGLKYKVYPTYDFACPIVDSIEGVTHALRTTEYHDRDEQYYWFIEKLGLRTLHIYEYSRLNMNNTVLSKRKLTWFVDEGLVDGWDDPRFPTVRGILRRGMSVEGLKDFIVAQGSSRSVVNMEWDKIWAFNKKVIDRYAPRYTALQGELVPVHITDVNEESTSAQKHPKDLSIGMKTVWTGPQVLVEAADAAELKEGQNATFINWGNIMIKKITKTNGKIVSIDAEPNLQNTDYKKTLKLTWLADTEKAATTPVVCVYFDHLVTKSVLGKDENFKDFIGHNTRAEVKMVGETELQKLVPGDIIQLQRKGFFRVDEAYKPVSLSSCQESPVILFSIPDGHSKDMPTASSIKKLAGMSEKEKVKSAQGKKAEKSPQDEVKPPVGGSSADTGQSLLIAIKDRGDKIRQLKSTKADKNVVMAEVEILKQLKKDFQDATGIEWKPDVVIPSSAPVLAATASVAGKNAVEIHSQIKSQGDIVRNLKASKADKDAIKQAVDLLLELKNEFKTATNVDWKPDIEISKFDSVAPAPAASTGGSGSAPLDLHNKIKDQGDKVRSLKASKADKDVVKQEVDVLLSLKKEFKEVTNSEWKPEIDISQFSSSSNASGSSGASSAKAIDLHSQIKKQGDSVRTLKANKADKDTIKQMVDQLLSLKKQFKECTSTEWKPDIDASQFSEDVVAPSRGMMTAPAEVNAAAKAKSTETRKPKETSLTKSTIQVPTKSDDGGMKKQTRLGLEVRKEQNLAEWYSQVITKSEMIEYYNVSGCYILRPWSYAIWDYIKDFLDKKIKTLGVENSYFPIFVAREALEKEKTHIADFSPEVAWVTRSGSSEMAEPVAIRPTSETVMYPAIAKWVQSHRDLPMKLNQWNNVVRWEFKQPTPFLRTREFLWQEGHSAFASKAEAEEEVYQILEFYAQVYEELLAVPVVKGKKTEKEKFAGADFTTTTEAFISASGRGIQGATSHHLGQNFSKMFEIVFEEPETQQKQYCFQNSWGLTTRTIGVMVMVHGDNKGLVLPPRVASVQAVIMPVGISAKSSEQEKQNLTDACNKLAADLNAAGVRTRCDLRDNVTPAWKFNHWELKGVPLRLELGPREVTAGQVFVVRRDNGEKQALNRATVGVQVLAMLDAIHDNLITRARADLNSHKVKVNSWKDFTGNLDKGNILLAPFCGQEECEDAIKKDSARDEAAEPGAPSMGAKGLCIPFEQPGEVNGLTCIHPSCKAKPLYYTLFGRSY